MHLFWMASGVVVVAAIVGCQPDPAVAPGDVASIVVSHGHSEVDGERVGVGLRVADGASIRTGSSGYLAMAMNRVDVRIAPDSVVALAGNEVHLEQGRVYVDTGTGPQVARFAVVTNLGRVQTQVHPEGTQFRVQTSVDELKFAVRQGRVELVTDWSRFEYGADAKQASLVTVWRAGTLELRNIPRYGGDWSWTQRATPGLELAGHSAHDALTWAAREQGYRLTYADTATRQRADEEVLRQTDHAMEPQQLLRLIPTMTGLNVDYDAGEVWVSKRDTARQR